MNRRIGKYNQHIMTDIDAKKSKKFHQHDFYCAELSNKCNELKFVKVCRETCAAKNLIGNISNKPGMLCYY